MEYTRRQALDLFCEKCYVGRMAERGVIDADQAAKECDMCAQRFLLENLLRQAEIE